MPKIKRQHTLIAIAVAAVAVLALGAAANRASALCTSPTRTFPAPGGAARQTGCTDAATGVQANGYGIQPSAGVKAIIVSCTVNVETPCTGARFASISGYDFNFNRVCHAVVTEGGVWNSTPCPNAAVGFRTSGGLL